MVSVTLRPRGVPYAALVMLACAALLGSCSGVSTEQTQPPQSQPLSVTTSTLPNAQVNRAYSATLAASGGTAPYTWSLAGGALPAGLSLDSASGAIAGTPSVSVAGAALTLMVTDSSSPAQNSSASLSLTVLPALAITSTSLPNGQVGSPYSTTLSASGGTGPYTWTLASGSLPAGLALNASSGVLSGTPTATAAATALTFRVTDSGTPAQSTTANLALTVIAAAPPPLAITTTSLPNGQVGSAYGTTLSASGGTGAYTWTLVSGTLPAGLALNAASGLLSGTPTATAAATALTFRVTDSGTPAQSTTANLTLTIAAAPLAITTTSLPNGQVGSPYSTTLSASGGTGPYTWTLVSGTLPAGLALNASSGVLSGTPTATAAATALTFRVTDSGTPAQSTTANLALTIAAAPLAITTTSLPNGVVGKAYSATLRASGGVTPYTWTLVSGTLPAGLALNAASGVLSGTPTATAAATALTFRVTDSGTPAQSTTANLTLTIAAAPLAITTTSLPNGVVGKVYNTKLTGTGGVKPYAWTLTSGSLPAGLTLTSTGVITGTPTATAAATPLTVKLTDSGAPPQSTTVNLTLTVVTALAITSTALPNGQVGQAYSTTLTATGGTPPFSWAVTAGTLPAGLTLNAATGVLSGTPTTTAAATPLTFTVTDTGSPVQAQSITLPLTVSPAGISVSSIVPGRAGLTVRQTLSIAATTNDNAGVNWSISPAGGSFNPATSLSGAIVTFTAPATAGVYTVTATSVTDPTRSASITVGVTDLAGVYTYHNDLARDGANTREFALTTANVNTATFGKLFSCSVDGAVYAQPLWVANLSIGGVPHNVVFVATEHDSLYAIDADGPACSKLWQVSLIDTSHGAAAAGETSVPAGTSGFKVGIGLGNLQPEVGVTGTPVIDPASNILYVVSKSMNSTGTTIYQRLHAIDLITGNEKPGSPATITGSYPGTSGGGTSVAFSAQQENQRAGLALVSGTVYIAWASHEDARPWFGWMAAYTYNGASFTQSSILNVAPDASEGGIWMGGGAPSADVNGHLYVITGNGAFDAANDASPNVDYGDSFLQLNSGLGITSWFSPSDQLSDNNNDRDFGSGGSAVVLNLSSGPVQHLVIGGGKDGALYLLNGDSMGGSGDSNAWQMFSVGSGIFGTPAFWNNTLYLAPISGAMVAYPFNTTTNMFTTTFTSRSNAAFPYPGSTASVSASGTTNGIVWALDNSLYCTGQSPGCGPAVLHAFKATNLFSELWNSSTVSTDAAGHAVKLTVPTIVNGKVFVGTRGNNTGGVFGSTSASGELDVYGLKP